MEASSQRDEGTRAVSGSSHAGYGTIRTTARLFASLRVGHWHPPPLGTPDSPEPTIRGAAFSSPPFHKYDDVSEGSKVAWAHLGQISPQTDATTRGFNEEGDRWTYFVKIVAVPTDAVCRNSEGDLCDFKDKTETGRTWFRADGVEIGPNIWNQFAVIQQVITGEIDLAFADFDLPFGGNFRSPAGSGLGAYKP